MLRVVICGTFGSMLASAAAWSADNQPNDLLKGVTIMQYESSVNDSSGDKICSVDWKAFNTSMAFVANQSTKLKLVSIRDHLTEMKARSEKIGELLERYSPTRMEENSAYFEARRQLKAYIFMPTLSIKVLIEDTGSGCAAELVATVRATLEPSKMLATGEEVSHPVIELWSDSDSVKTTYKDVSSSILQKGEQAMKVFVNAWAASQ